MFLYATSHPLSASFFFLRRKAKGFLGGYAVGVMPLLKVVAVGFVILVFVKNYNIIYLGFKWIF